jgi:hypothetical protein
MAIQTDLASKVDKVDGKDLSTNDYTTAEKTKLAAITGTNTGDQTTITGNAGTATKLATARNINGVAFDGSADITIAAAVGADGKTVRNGTSNPVSGTGVDGDFYINTANNTIFGPKTNGTWPSGVSLVGPAGTNGVSASSANFVDLTTGQTIAGVKTFSGKIAMGTSTPSAKLEIVGGTRNDMLRLVSDDNPSVSFKNTDPSGGAANDGEYQLFAAGNAGNPSINPGTFGIYYDHGSNAGYRLGITNTGNVGIGTAKPTEKLDVAGNVKTSGTLTAGTVTYPNSHNSTTGQVLTINNTGTASWAAPSASGGGSGTVTSVAALTLGNSGTDLSSSVANGTSTPVITLNVPDASANARGVITTGTQTIAGAKTFSSDITVNGVKIGRGAGNNDQNVAVGADALASGTGTRNTAIGYGAMRQYSGTSFDNNTSVGYFNMPSLTLGNGNTSVGAESMLNLSTGTQNTSIGNQSLINTTGSENVGVGKSSGDINTSGSQNTFVGTNSNAGANNLSNATAIGYSASVSTSNTIQLGNTNITNVKTSGTITADAVTYPKAHGTSGQILSTTGSGTLTWITPASGGIPYTGATGAVNLGAYDLTVHGLTVGRGTGSIATNTVVGRNALKSNSTGSENTVLGDNALFNNTTGVDNVAIGPSALLNNTTGGANISIGINSMQRNTTANHNTAVGYHALYQNETGTRNSAFGSRAMFYNTGSDNNTFGEQSLYSNSGAGNNAFGNGALYGNTSGSENNAIGYGSLGANTTGSGNTAIGSRSLNVNTTGSNNTVIGNNANVGANNLTNATAIGNGATVAASNTIQLGNSSVTNINTSGTITATGLTVSGNVTSSSGSISGFDAALNDQTGTSYTLTSADNGKVVTLNNSSAITLTINTGLGDGFNCLIVQKGAGQITMAGTATRINRQNHTKTAGQYAVVSIVNIGSEQVIVAGDTGN